MLFRSDDGRTRLEVRIENETVWLSENQMAELFQTSIPNVSMHIRTIFAEGELQPSSVIKDFFNNCLGRQELPDPTTSTSLSRSATA